MRQAGRYLREYRVIRAKASLLEICHRPELATGRPMGGPPIMPVKTYQVKVEGDKILVG